MSEQPQEARSAATGDDPARVRDEATEIYAALRRAGAGCPTFWGYLRERTTVEHQIWTTDEQGREILVASTKIGSDAGVVFDAVKDARSFVEWRTAAHGQHKGRLFRGWDGEKGELYGPSMEANLA